MILVEWTKFWNKKNHPKHGFLSSIQSDSDLRFLSHVLATAGDIAQRSIRPAANVAVRVVADQYAAAIASCHRIIKAVSLTSHKRHKWIKEIRLSDNIIRYQSSEESYENQEKNDVGASTFVDNDFVRFVLFSTTPVLILNKFQNIQNSKLIERKWIKSTGWYLWMSIGRHRFHTFRCQATQTHDGNANVKISTKLFE